MKTLKDFADKYVYLYNPTTKATEADKRAVKEYKDYILAVKDGLKEAIDLIIPDGNPLSLQIKLEFLIRKIDKEIKENNNIIS